MKAASKLQSMLDVVMALPCPAALFAPDGGLCGQNHAFTEEFSSLQDGSTLAAWWAQFEPFDTARSEPSTQAREWFCASIKRWYRIDIRDVCGFHLLLANNINERVEAVNFHKSQQDKLLFTSRMMSVGELTTTLAHELNQPLASIVNYLSTAVKWVDRIAEPPPRLRDALLLARQQAERAAQVVQRLRDFVRTREPRRSVLALAETASHVVQLLELEAQKHRVRLQTHVPASFAPVFADRVMIEQVMFNLVKNAIEATREVAPTERAVDIHARTTLDGNAELRVCDNGVGLQAGAEQNIFTPFHTTKADGMGIGLSICRSIIEYHEGRMFFEANPSGAGAIFGFRIPHASAAELRI
jgi:C4-dicarboxylate-specific signal transduction histidine kinase